MAKLSKKAIKRLRIVKQQILDMPELYDQTTYAGDKNPCGTACCLAGWLVWNDDPKRFAEAARKSNVDYLSGRALELVDGNEGSALFGTGNAWPEPFGSQFALAIGNSTKASIAAARIEHFIATGGAE